jgi:hypothetical protein
MMRIRIWDLLTLDPQFIPEGQGVGWERPDTQPFQRIPFMNKAFSKLRIVGYGRKMAIGKSSIFV